MSASFLYFGCIDDLISTLNLVQIGGRSFENTYVGVWAPLKTFELSLSEHMTNANVIVE